MLVESEKQVDEWVIDSHTIEPMKIDLEEIFAGKRMKILELYKFLKNL